MANTTIKLVFGLFFLAFNKSKVNFAERELVWKTYTSEKALLTTKLMQMIDQKKFAVAALAPEEEAFVEHVAYLGAKMLMHPPRKAQVVFLLAKEVSVPENILTFQTFYLKNLRQCFPIGQISMNTQ